ncbi:carbon-nitrogen hydrolase family protein [Campylobacter lari]|uniref:carbon-nitrogen hydrolase family protein n=1 Tax=Campylobacter lari TaxID=201 RepID=UPI0012C47ABF|nr:carbon-nitrogen hydrolase family protein [Campylobacter lari]EAK9882051.1 carbon-nitrogen hydrolase family protein [Campylobacter lari]EGK8036447.1 carbon-nitrogen hydrolase family protein [Campylobacter lari]EGK8091922.1 carbon-nitrogen hydrolase family protein [Campylobacter lari]MCW0185150.1 carbon-nitrogen hydrolase family protein [Campylobacter lari]HEC1786135.1 carbon-nitrogen hydrolase family protein [Campylobacter lari]
MKIALAQIKTSPKWQENLEKILILIKKAKQNSTDLIVFPETSMAFVPNGGDFGAIAQSEDDEFVQGILKESKDLNICVVFGFFEKDIQKTKNSVIFADSGKIIHKYSKTHLYNAFSYDESKDIKEADNPLKAFDTRFGKMGLMVCYELRFPEIARTLALQGAKLIIVPTAWVDGDLKKEHFSLLTRTRALENTLFLCACSQTKNIYTGHSSLINPLGIELIKMSEEEGLEFSEINLDEIKEVRKILPCLEQRRKELYGL